MAQRVYEKENKEFLEKYNTEAAQIDYYIGQIENIFDVVGIEGEYTYGGIKSNVEAWMMEKQPIFEILRKHPNWNEEAKSLIFMREEIRSSDLDEYQCIFNELERYVKDKLMSYGIYNQVWGILNVLEGRSDKLITEYEVSEMRAWENNLSYKFNLAKGMKRSRAINACYSKFPISANRYVNATKFVDEHEAGSRDYQSYDKIFAKLADSTNPLKTNRITVLSANINDFLLMSNGNSWHSCHFINSDYEYDGCYKAGTLSYAVDGCTMCLYTLPETYTGNSWYLEPKIHRQLFCYENGVLLQSRLYPTTANRICDDYRAFVQEIISKCLDIPNLWVRSSSKGASDFTQTDSASKHYRDYECFDREVVFTTNKEIYDSTADWDNRVLHIGGESYCIDCGGSMRYEGTENLQCGRCAECKTYCACCENVYDEDEMHYVDGVGMCCDDCCTYCDECNEYVLNDDIHEVYFADIDEYRNVCDACLNNFEYCENCENYIYDSDNAYYEEDLGETRCCNCHQDYLDSLEEDEEDE